VALQPPDRRYRCERIPTEIKVGFLEDESSSMIRIHSRPGDWETRLYGSFPGERRKVMAAVIRSGSRLCDIKRGHVKIGT
jgi:hypothetical protein